MKKQHLKRCLAVCAGLLFSFWLISCGKPAPELKKVRVLFIGNSLTYTNDLPGLTAELARSRGIELEHDMYAPGGYTLSQHSRDPVLLEKINKGGWDYVVLQEQSEMPAYPWAPTEVFPYARTLSRIIRDADPRAQVVFFMTMARKFGEQRDVRNFPDIATYEGMQRKLNDSYTGMALENQGILVPVGRVWENVRARNPALNLYGDDVHPNLAGTYLAACAFYAVLFKDSPAGLPHPGPLDDETAAYLQKAVSDTLAAETK